MILIVKFGSHLYGTDTPESDLDYKGIYLPSLNELMLNRVSKSLNFDTNKRNTKNDADDVDFEVYSLHYFLELARKGETVAIDMLHANDASIIYKSPVWDEIVAHRSMFYTNSMKALIGYARKQAAKYGLKGSRLSSAKQLRELLSVHDPDNRIHSVFDAIQEDDNIKKGENDQGIGVINFCGKQIQETVRISYAIDMIDAFINQYGHRAKQAETNDGVDWKAISHAMRAALQLKEIYTTGDLKFPLQDAEFLLKIKQGQYNFNTVLSALENAIDKVERFAFESSLPEKVDSSKVDKLLLDLLEKEYVC